GVRRFHRLDRVAGIDRPLEGVRRDNFGDVGNLHDIEQGGNTRHHILAGGCRRRNDRVVTAGERDDQRGERLRELVLIGRGVGDQNFFHAVQLGGGGGGGFAILAGD